MRRAPATSATARPAGGAAIDAPNLLDAFAPTPGTPPGTEVDLFDVALVGAYVLSTLAGGAALLWLRGRLRTAIPPDPN